MSNLRVIDPATITLLSSGRAGIVALVRIDTTPVILVTNTNRPVTFGTDVYLAAGALGAIGDSKDKTGETVGLSFEMSGCSVEGISLALQDNVRGSRTRVWLGVVNRDTGVLAEAVPLYDGQIDQMPIKFQVPNSVISATTIHRGKIMARARPFLYTDGAQQAAAPGDTSGRFLVSQAEAKDVWPAAAWGRQ